MLCRNVGEDVSKWITGNGTGSDAALPLNCCEFIQFCPPIAWTVETQKYTQAHITRITTAVLLTVGGDRLMAEPRRSCGPMLECRRMGRPPPGVPPGDEAHDGAMRILGVISVLSESRRLGKAFTTRRKLLSGDMGDWNQPEPVRNEHR